MSASYDAKLTTDLDWVRFLIGDTSVDAAKVDDEEIAAVLSDLSDQWGGGAWNRYLAAAEILDGLMAKWISQGGGIIEKEVSKLKIKRGIMYGAEDAIRHRVADLRREGARRRTPRPRTFEVL